MDPVLGSDHHLTTRTLGAVAIDATTGDGHDTPHLAQAVGSGGHVYGFDIQAQAIARTWRGRAGAVMSNLHV